MEGNCFTGEISPPRAAHASVIIGNKMLIFGGSNGNDENCLLDDDLYVCSDFKEGVWKIINVSEEEIKNNFLLNLKQKNIPFIKVAELHIFR